MTVTTKNLVHMTILQIWPKICKLEIMKTQWLVAIFQVIKLAIGCCRTHVASRVVRGRLHHPGYFLLLSSMVRCRWKRENDIDVVETIQITCPSIIGQHGIRGKKRWEQEKVKHHKDCECPPCHSLFKGPLWMMRLLSSIVRNVIIFQKPQISGIALCWYWNC